MLNAWMVGSISALTSVILGAFGSHALKQKLQTHPEGTRKLQNWNTGVQYQFIHSLGLLAYSLRSTDSGFGRFVPLLFGTGILCFSGSLYLLTLDIGNKKVLGPITPIGGLCFVAGWTAMALL